MPWSIEKDISGFTVRRSVEVTQRYKEAGHWRDETLTDVARRRVQEGPARTLLIEGEREISRAEALEQANRVSAYLLNRGLKPGDVISFQLPNWIEASIISLAARMCGLVINPVPPNYRDSETSYILNDCGSKLIFIPEIFRKFDYLEMLRRLKPQIPTLEDFIIVRSASSGEPRWEDVLAMAPAAPHELPHVDAAAVMMAIYTSGTTSRPKGVMHSHQTYGFKVCEMGDVWQITEKDVIFMPSPVTHITGGFWCVDAPWVYGAPSVLVDVWTGEIGMQCIERHRCTITGGATPFLQQLLDMAADRAGAVNSLRIFFCGGTTVSPDLIKKAGQTFPDCLFFRAYGCTEMPSITLGIQTKAQANLGAETDGEVIPPTEVKLLAPDGDQAVAEGEEGEIAACGAEQFLGYLHAEDNAHYFDEDGYYRTGDLGRRVHGSYLVITGRKKDIIIRSGENISPKEVEDALFDHPGIAEVAIVAMPSPKTGEMGCAFVMLRGETEVDLAGIQQHLERAGLARQKFPEHLVFVADLPRVASGKVRKEVLRAEAKKIADERRN